MPWPCRAARRQARRSMEGALQSCTQQRWSHPGSGDVTSEEVLLLQRWAEKQSRGAPLQAKQLSLRGLEGWVSQAPGLRLDFLAGQPKVQGSPPKAMRFEDV
mmetsp:Transcript_120324/g.300163  ORF Transcript_120324/g.300163 Transcript_120324/m.300163 type:complete len:102 (-) Transcript_120324:244-549(-)